MIEEAKLVKPAPEPRPVEKKEHNVESEFRNLVSRSAFRSEAT